MSGSKVLRGPFRSHVITAGSGGGGTIICAIQPPEGELWRVKQVRATHDDAAGLAVDWLWVDADGAETAVLYANTAVPRYLGTDIPSQGPWDCVYTSYLAFRAAGMAGAKTITLNLVYERILGISLSTVL